MSEYEAKMSEIGKRIHQERLAKGLGQKEFLRRIFMSESSTKTLTAWERGERLPDLDSLCKMSELFQCDIGYLLCDFDTRRHENADICMETGLSEESVSLLRKNAKLGFTTEAKVLDLLLSDAKYWNISNSRKSYGFRSILNLLGFFFKFDDIFMQPKQVFANGQIEDYNPDSRYISENAIRLNGSIIENAVLMEIEQALINLKNTKEEAENNG